MLYIIEKSNYNGRILSTMPDNIEDAKVNYTDKTFREYNEEHGGDLIALDWETFYANYYAPYLKSLCKPFQEITECEYYEMLNCLPPRRWTQFDGGSFFFCSEMTTGDLSGCYIRKGEKYFSGLRSVYASDDELLNEIKNL